MTLVTQTNESKATRLLAGGGGVLAATGNLGKIYRSQADQPGSAGTYESPVHDAGGGVAPDGGGSTGGRQAQASSFELARAIRCGPIRPGAIGRIRWGHRGLVQSP